MRIERKARRVAVQFLVAVKYPLLRREHRVRESRESEQNTRGSDTDEQDVMPRLYHTELDEIAARGV